MDGAQRVPLGVWALACTKFAALLASTRLGYHRDELYFVAASKRLSASYVDFQPVVPLLTRLDRAIFGDHLLALRLIPALAAAVAVVLAALIARELGGSGRAQLFAAFCLVVVPLFLGMGSTLNTVVLETPAWMLVAYVVARLLRTGDKRLWIALGFAISLALLVKFTVLAYLTGLAIAVFASPLRRHFRTPWPWFGGLVVAAALAPSIAWQASHDWAVVEFVRHQGTGGRILGLGGRLGFVVSLVLLPGPFALFVWIPGLRRLWRDQRFRIIGVTHAIALLVLFAASGKGYYAAPGIAVLLSAGAVAVDAKPNWSPRPLAIALAVTALTALPFFVSPVSWLRGSRALARATELSERIGWEELAQQVSRVYQKLPRRDRERAVVIGRNYTLPAAIEFYADRYPLPAAGSGHNSSYLWQPPAGEDRVTIAIAFGGRRLHDWYRHVTRVGTFRNSERVEGYDWGDPIYVARDPKVSWDEQWREMKVFTA